MYNYNEIEGILCTKTLLIAQDSEGIIKSVRNENDFKRFLHYISEIYNKESPFFLLSEYTSFEMINNVFDFISEYRFKYRDPAILNVCNQIIGVLNSLKIKPLEEKARQLVQYIMYQEDIRNIDLHGNFDALAVSMSIDYTLYMDNLTDLYEKGFKDFILVYGSIHYFLNSFDEALMDPEFILSIQNNLYILKNKVKDRSLKRNIKYLEKQFRWDADKHKKYLLNKLKDE